MKRFRSLLAILGIGTLLSSCGSDMPKNWTGGDPLDGFENSRPTVMHGAAGAEAASSAEVW